MIDREKLFLIDGHPFDRDGLISFCAGNITSPDTPGWEREIWEFILEWFAQDNYLEVQTSGSTGHPKRIKLLKNHIKASARLTLGFFVLHPRDTALLCLPVKYIAGKMMIVRAFEGGLNLLLTEPSSAPDLIGFDRITFSAMVPLQIMEILETADGFSQLEKIESLIIGGAFLHKPLEEKLKIVNNNIWQTYGMTETISHIALRRLNGPNAQEWYKPLPYVDLQKDKRGCLIITAPHIGVKNLVTNDLVTFNNKGDFKIKGRYDNVIISGGIKLFPEKIEQKLSGLIENEFFVAGLPDDKLGEKLVLFIEDSPEIQQKKKFLWKMIKNRLAGYDIPKEIVFIKTFLRSNNGKVMRQPTLENYLANRA